MKSPEVIDKIEKALPEVLRNCRYCEGLPVLHVRKDRNSDGEKGYIATVRCKCCGVSVFAFGTDERSAKVMARHYWQKGIADLL